MHEHSIGARLTELVGQLEQLLGHATRHVGEDKIGESLIGAAQSLGERLQQRLSDLGAAGEPRPQVRVPQPHDDGVGDSRGRGRARARIEERQLAEDLTRSEYGEQRLAPIGGGLTELDLAVQDHVHPVTGLALGEDHAAAGHALLRHRGAQGCSGLGVER